RSLGQHLDTVGLVDDRHPSLAVGPVLGRALVEFWLAVSGLLGRLADIRRCCEMPFCRWAYQTTRRARFLRGKRGKRRRPHGPVVGLRRVSACRIGSFGASGSCPAVLRNAVLPVGIPNNSARSISEL